MSARSITEHARSFYVDGEWIAPLGTSTIDVVDPATEEPITQLGLGDERDVDVAVAAARRAFETYSTTTREERLELLDAIMEAYSKRIDEVAAMISREMGAPRWLADAAQAPAGLGHFAGARAVLAGYEFERRLGETLVIREPVGVCALITPWNWPIHQVAAKVAPALSVGCTMVLKPSEVAPLSAILLAEILDEAGTPPGVFNLVNGDGSVVGRALAGNPDVDMISFTGSTRAGIDVAQLAAPSVKRVTQELGGKSANIILDDDDLAEAVARDVRGLCVNSGQSCNAPSRMLVPRDRMAEAASAAAAAAAEITVGDPSEPSAFVGPLASAAQYERVQRYIEQGINEGATLVAGGLGRPEGHDVGYFVQPTVFANVDNDMTIAREEIFGPVLAIIGYDDEDDAVRIANDTSFGLSGYVSGDVDSARSIARRLRTGNVHLNGAPVDLAAPFGGYKQSGNGREWGAYGFEEYLETKAIVGFGA